MKLLLIALAVVSIFLSLSIGIVFAAQPNHQACIGEDVSSYAQSGSDFGGFVSGIASTTSQGIGDEVQAHQAGLIPDSVIPNTCND